MLIAKISTYQLLGWPHEIGIGMCTAGLFALVLAGIGLTPAGTIISLPAKVRTWVGIFGFAVLVGGLLMFSPFWTQSDTNLASGKALNYRGGPPPSRADRWLSDLGAFVQDGNARSGIPLDQFQILILETEPFTSPVEKLTVVIIPVHEKLKIENMYAFQATGKTSQRFYRAIAPKKAPPGYELPELSLEKDDTIVCLIDVRKLQQTGVTFPTTSQIASAFKLSIK